MQLHLTKRKVLEVGRKSAQTCLAHHAKKLSMHLGEIKNLTSYLMQTASLERADWMHELSLDMDIIRFMSHTLFEVAYRIFSVFTPDSLKTALMETFNKQLLPPSLTLAGTLVSCQCSHNFLSKFMLVF